MPNKIEIKIDENAEGQLIIDYRSRGFSGSSLVIKEVEAIMRLVHKHIRKRAKNGFIVEKEH